MQKNYHTGSFPDPARICQAGDMFQSIGEMVVLFLRTLQALPKLWRQKQKFFDQLFEIGNASLLMACVLSLFIGGVISLQTGNLLAKYGLSTSIGGGVGMAMAKELGPLMMAILIAGRIGSAMAAEIGSMRVYQEIDALRTMNIYPHPLPGSAAHHRHQRRAAHAHAVLDPGRLVRRCHGGGGQ